MKKTTTHEVVTIGINDPFKEASKHINEPADIIPQEGYYDAYM